MNQHANLPYHQERSGYATAEDNQLRMEKNTEEPACTCKIQKFFSNVASYVK